MRIDDHPILGAAPPRRTVTVIVDGEPIRAFEGEMIAAALAAAGRRHLRFTGKHGQPRGVFCAIGRCTDCIMTVNDKPNVRTCVTPVQDGMIVQTQRGLGKWA
ncbi:MAG: (2Fe-2S)-binding protein [Deltaproteobacteria bacterium]|nr:(2Fe-2S)-binding protein [Deltaproteobacteria bacterium]